MSRIGKKPVVIPSGVNVSMEKGIVLVKGPKGSLTFEINNEVSVKIEEGSLQVEMVAKTKQTPAIWGTTSRIIENMIIGVTEGFSKQLELNGVGYRMSMSGKKVNLALGFSHPVEVEVPEGLDVKVEGNVMTVSGIDKHAVGQFSANVRALKPVEPYKGKGFRYVGEVVRKKEGKKSAS